MAKTPEEKKAEAREYYQKNRRKIIGQVQARYRKSQGPKLRRKRFAGRHCLLCEIRLDSDYGAKRTIRYCVSCSKESKLQSRIRCRKYYHKKHHGIILSTKEIAQKISS